ncbi:hypothetical protein OPT61_g10558 [Boeremia exigua]|uniref:Uncharacterized protein n=1 Tax=Boeremia exigua TaxID=749465 RepID=A0ACC2HP35_9PLEO|nr:hypothetical protein OPT61_g10558 [Boeremia exigua]
MNSVRAIQQLNKRELEASITPEGSWHTDYRDTAFIYIGGLAFELSEGDIITIFSQYGEPVWVKLARDKETGKSRGFAWIKYEDQRSCDLAVDNLGGATIMDRVVRVDHARYKPRDDEDMRDNTMGDVELDDAHDEDKRRRSEDTESDDDRPLLPEEMELERLTEKLDLDDPMRDSMIKEQQEKVDEAVARLKRKMRREKEKKSRHERRRRDGSRDRRDRDRKRIKDGEDDRRSRRRDDHSRSREDRHRKSTHRDDSKDRDRRHRRDRSRERRDRSEGDKDRRCRHSSASEDEKKPRSRRSPSPYRARSP